LTEGKLTAVAIVNRFGHWFGTGLIVPVLAIFQIDRGLSLTQVGINGLIFAAMVAVLEIPTGGLSDTLGRRRVYLISLVVSIVASGVFVFARSPVTLAAGFGLMGMARALSSGCMDAYFIDAFDALEISGELQRFLARIGVFVPLSLAFGGLLGGFIPEWADGVVATNGLLDRYSFLFSVVVLAGVLQLFMTVALLPCDRPVDSVGGIAKGLSRFPTVLRDSIRLGVANRAVLLLLLGSAAWGVAFAGLEQFWQPYVDRFTSSESPTRLFGYLTTGYFLVGSLGAIASSRLFRAIGTRYGSTVGVLRFAMGTLFILLSFTSSVPLFATVYLALFFLNGVNDSPEQAMFNSRVPSSARSTLLSFQSLFLQLGGGVAAVVWGVISEQYSIGLSWRIAGTLFALSGLFYIRSGSNPASSSDQTLNTSSS